MNATTADLRALQAFMLGLRDTNHRVVRAIRARIDSVAEKANLEDPRAFAYTRPGEDSVIRYAPALNDLDRNYRTGILLHEIGHIVIGARNKDADDDEVDVDAWVVRNYPESGYAYKSCVYLRTGYGAPQVVEARNIEWVSTAFLAIVDGRA